jgi:NAD-dependent protein deacetylase/lipoamidase sirtuin 4
MSVRSLGSSRSAACLDPLIEMLRNRVVTVLTGAGCSTESGIPDYGGLASRYRRTRVQFTEFTRDPAARARYWSRSMIGWRAVANARPNAAHVALASLEHAGSVAGVITQNVDDLHQHAGSQNVVELHGSLSWVRCLQCGAIESRSDVQQRLQALNPGYGSDALEALAPDGDAELREHAGTFRVPGCAICDGTIKPDVVFFGESVPRDRIAKAWSVYERGEVLLVVGSSLAVYSGYRFVQRASRDGRPVAIINLGPTRGDADAALKIEDHVGPVLESLVHELGAAAR